MNWNSLLEKRDQYSDTIRHLIRCSNGAIPPFATSVSEGRSLALLSITNWKELAYLLKCSPLHVEQLINEPTYFEFTIPKKKGKPRLICQPNAQLMKIQRRLNKFFQAIYQFQMPTCVHGFVPKTNDINRSIVTNAFQHLNKSNILTLDLKDYFPSIKAKRIRDLFRSWGMNDEMSIALTLLCTFKGSLPAGAPTSPVLANLCSLELDNQLMSLSEQHQLTYTRYADDLTFSSPHFIPDSVISTLIKSISSNQFQVNNSKTHCIGKHRKQKITGIVVNQKLSIDRKLKKKIRAMEHDIRLNGLAVASERHFQLQEPSTDAIQNHFLRKVLGLKSFVRMVENYRFGGS